MIHSKKTMFAFLALLTCQSMQPVKVPVVSNVVSTVQKYVSDYPTEAKLVALAALLARPAYDLFDQWMKQSDQNPYSLLSLLGFKVGIKPKNKQHKDAQFRAQLSVGSADATLKTPDVEGMKKLLKAMNPKTAVQKRNVADFLNFLEAYPSLLINVEEQTSPVVRNKEAGVAATVKRLCAKFKWGKFEFRAGMDLNEAVYVPGAMVAAYAMHMLNQYLQSQKAVPTSPVAA